MANLYRFLILSVTAMVVFVSCTCNSDEDDKGTNDITTTPASGSGSSGTGGAQEAAGSSDPSSAGSGSDSTGDSTDSTVSNPIDAGQKDSSDTSSKAGSESKAGSGSSEVDAAEVDDCPDAQYECLQEMSNTTARVCPNLRQYNPGISSRAFDPCEEGLCPNSHCVSESMISPPESIPQFYKCAKSDEVTTYYCVPDFLIDTAGGAQWKKCRSIGNMEGVCIPSCMKEVKENPATADLPQDVCGEGEQCIPCYDGMTGEASPNTCMNVSEIACNPEPEEDPVIWEKCCNQRGACVPGIVDLIDETRIAAFGKDSCTGEGELCVPEVMSSVMPPICTTDDGAVGRCLPDCMSIVKDASPAWSKGNCSADEDMCVPCEQDGQDIGVCSFVRGDSSDRTE